MPVATEAAALVAASRCYCLPKREALAVLTYIFAVDAGLDGLTPAQLLDRAKCYLCLEPGRQRAVQNYLLNLIAGAET